MGWPLAVSAGLMGDGRRDLFGALGPLALGHFLAMILVLLPFAFMAFLIDWQREIRIGAALLVIAAGIYLLINRRHPRFLARIKPTQLALWSFAVAMAHGAGLMLLPIYLGMGGGEGPHAHHAQEAAQLGSGFVTAMSVAVIHTIAMFLSGGVIAFFVYEWFGLTFISKSWFNLDVIWALSLILVGAIGLWSALYWI